MQPTAKKSSSLFPYLLILTLCFIFFELSFFIQGNKAYIEGFYFLTDKIQFSLAQLPELLLFITIQLSVHIIFCACIWLLTLQVGIILGFTETQQFKLGITLWLLTISTVLLANAFYFPNSHFAYLIYFGFSPLTVEVLLIIGLISLGAAFILAVISLFTQGNNYSKLMLAALLCAGIIISLPITQHPKPSRVSEQPNIILIGFDSLRPDFLSYFGATKKTPNFDAYVKQSTVFTEAMTPLARTFPSWVGILTGEHPFKTGIRSNLMAQNDLDLTQTLPAILQRHGYETIYATDETRFSNIDKNFGFDEVITPPMGVNDFILGSFNDFPITNLLINTDLGAWLFPYSYGNRPVYHTYNPDMFLRLMQPAIEQSRQKPLFLAVHFCLTHHPYIWANLEEKKRPTLALYQAAIQRSDQVLQDFLALLNTNHILDNAIVVLLSDHGEAIELTGDRVTDAKLFVATETQKTPPQFYPPPLNKGEQMNESAGHGTDVLGLSQYRSLLAIRVFGGQPALPKQIHERVSLLAIKATVLDLANIPYTRTTPSLANLVRGVAWAQPRMTGQEDLFIESDYSPQSIRALFPDIKQVVFDSAELYRVDPSTSRLLLRDDMLSKIIQSKQYADLRGDWVLALYPQKNSHRLPILVNLRTGQWTHDLRTPFAQQSPAASMLTALQKFYGQELGIVDNVQ